MCFRVDGDFGASATIQMHGKHGNSGNGFVDADQFLFDFPRCVFEQDAAAQPQITVEPRAPEAPAVGLDGHLQHAFGSLFGSGFEFEVGTVGVAADNNETVACFVLFSNRPGHQRGAHTIKEVFATGLNDFSPGIAFEELDKTSGGETCFALRNGVVAGPRGVEKINEFLREFGVVGEVGGVGRVGGGGDGRHLVFDLFG